MHPLADTGRVIARRYRLEAPIGRGAMGVVWRAHDQLLDREVAIKEVQIADTLTDAERANAFQRTLREAKTAARLNHPAVVTVYDVAEDGGRPWIVMQLVHAQSLDQVLASSGPLSARRAAEMGRQLLSALSVAHAAGVMHRDVKPSNVLLGSDDRAVLTDFGIATFQGDPRLTQTGMVMGSPGFTAPERIRGEDASPASDLWSLGATLFAAVEGHGPFERRGGAITTMSAIINEDAPEAPAAGPLAPVIGALLRREPADRPDALTAVRMISDVLPLLPDRTPGAAAGHPATALSSSPASPVPGSPGPGSPGVPGGGPRSPGGAGAAVPGQTSLDAVAAADAAGALGAAGPVGLAGSGAAGYAAGPGDLADAGAAVDLAPAEQSAPTTPQPPPGDAPRYREEPPPDFSSWYSPSGRQAPASAGSGQAGPRPGPPPGPPGPPGPPSGSAQHVQSGPAAWSGPGYQPPSAPAPQAGTKAGYPPPRRRRGLWWKLALVALALIGAGAGVATVMAFRHHNAGASHGRGTPSTGPTATPPELARAVNRQLTGPPPAGYRRYAQPAAAGQAAGFGMDIPRGWTVTRTRNRTYIADPADPAKDIHLLVDLTPHTYPDMVREATFIEGRSGFAGYQRVGLAPLTIRGTAGAWWEFTWVRKGTAQTALDLLFIVDTPSGQQSYALYATAPTSIWGQLQPVFAEELRTFAPLQP